MKRETSREQAFEAYFAEIYGERWPALRAAMLREPEREVLRNPFGAGLQDYILDRASLAPVNNLRLEPGLMIADFCASPGGKSLAAIFRLRGEGRWFCNDLSPGRLTRLKSVFYDCLPESVIGRVKFGRGDASRFGLKFKETFDRVLIDAPCSGERHLLGSKRELARWSLKGVKRLCVRQHALLCAGFDSLKPGGRLVYSTCAIAPLENDGVIQKLFKSRPEAFQIAKPLAESGEPTEFGWILLPDRTGCGPIYFSAIDKI